MGLRGGKMHLDSTSRLLWAELCYLNIPNSTHGALECSSGDSAFKEVINLK